MIADALTRMPFRSPAEATAIALAKAQSRLPVGQPASRMDGASGRVLGIEARDGSIIVLIELPDGRTVSEMAGMWHGRSAL